MIIKTTYTENSRAGITRDYEQLHVGPELGLLNTTFY